MVWDFDANYDKYETIKHEDRRVSRRNDEHKGKAGDEKFLKCGIYLHT